MCVVCSAPVVVVSTVRQPKLLGGKTRRRRGLAAIAPTMDGAHRSRRSSRHQPTGTWVHPGCRPPTC
jgi:hypothetical protein